MPRPSSWDDYFPALQPAYERSSPAADARRAPFGVARSRTTRRLAMSRHLNVADAVSAGPRMKFQVPAATAAAVATRAIASPTRHERPLGRAERRLARPGASAGRAEPARLHRGRELRAAPDRQHEQRERHAEEPAQPPRSATPRARRASSSARQSSRNSPTIRSPASAPSTKRAGQLQHLTEAVGEVGRIDGREQHDRRQRDREHAEGRGEREHERPLAHPHEEPVDVDLAARAGRRARS